MILRREVLPVYRHGIGKRIIVATAIAVGLLVGQQCGRAMREIDAVAITSSPSFIAAMRLWISSGAAR